MYSCVKALHLPDDSNESDINVVDNEGHTAFHLACLNGHFPVVDYLCTCGADLEIWYVGVSLASCTLKVVPFLVKGRQKHH